jgi:hypothetical protein
MLAGQLALVLAAAFTGAAFYVNFAEQPARLQFDDANLLKQWKSSYAAGFTMQATLAALSGALGLAAAWSGEDWRWILGALLILANWPFTLFGIMPINTKLEALSDANVPPQARALIMEWARLHAIRTTLGGAATLAYLWAAN